MINNIKVTIPVFLYLQQINSKVFVNVVSKHHLNHDEINLVQISGLTTILDDFKSENEKYKSVKHTTDYIAVPYVFELSRDPTLANSLQISPGTYHPTLSGYKELLSDYEQQTISTKRRKLMDHILEKRMSHDYSKVEIKEESYEQKSDMIQEFDLLQTINNLTRDSQMSVNINESDFKNVTNDEHQIKHESDILRYSEKFNMDDEQRRNLKMLININYIRSTDFIIKNGILILDSPFVYAIGDYLSNRQGLDKLKCPCHGRGVHRFDRICKRSNYESLLQ
jgi:hypothetical protein